MGCIEEVVDLVSAAIPARASILQGAPRHGRRWQRSRGQSASEGAQTHSLRVYCDAPILVCALIALAGGAASFTPNVSTTGEFLQTNSGSLTLNGASPTGQSCIITSPFDQSGTQDGTLETGLGGPVAYAHWHRRHHRDSSDPPSLKLGAKKQKLKKKLTFFATTNVTTTLVAGGSVKPTTKKLAGGERTKVRATPKKKGAEEA